MLISVITAASRLNHLNQLLRDMRNQTVQDMEHLIVWDGNIPDEARTLVASAGYNAKLFYSKGKRDPTAPGTAPRNYGIQRATAPFICFADDDDRYADVWLERLLRGCSDTSIGVVQMNCPEYKINGKHTSRFRLIPEVDLKAFPVPCHIGTPCFAVPRQMAVDNPWQSESDHLHDFHFIQRICEKYKPVIHLEPGWSVDVDGAQVGRIRDWVSKPPYWRP